MTEKLSRGERGAVVAVGLGGLAVVGLDIALLAAPRIKEEQIRNSAEIVERLPEGTTCAQRREKVAKELGLAEEAYRVSDATNDPGDGLTAAALMSVTNADIADAYGEDCNALPQVRRDAPT